METWAPTLTLPLVVLAAHFVGDFVLQSNWMAINKARRLDALLAHCVVYALCFVPLGPDFVLVTFGLHFAVDAVTSRATSALWFVRGINAVSDRGAVYTKLANGDLNVEITAPAKMVCSIAYDMRKRHWFFVVIGLDQLAHYACLVAAYRWFVA